MAKQRTHHVCQSCGSVHSKWAGKCEACGEWNTLVEELIETGEPGGLGVAAPPAPAGSAAFLDLSGEPSTIGRLQTGMAELDRVLGGGLAPASAVLISGDPGVGKSTLLLQAAARLAMAGAATAYVSGEEAVDQIRQRAARLGAAHAPVKLASETSLRATLAALKALKPDVVIADSVQTFWSDAFTAAPGSIAQVRAAAQEFVRFAKKTGAAVILVGHVTKDGQIAGPRVLEHMVDAVLYLEGERGGPYRIVRGVKNRYGATDEIGVFEMTEKGMAEVEDPSRLFLDRDREPTPGSAVFAGVEGTRPVLVEIQALAASAAYGTPRRAVVGWDAARLAMTLAVLEARCGAPFGGRDVYLNVAGGLRIHEPACDLAAAAALISSARDAPLPQDTVYFGEVSLSGAVRPVGRVEARLREAQKLGFKRAVTAAGDEAAPSGMQVRRVSKLADLFEELQ